MSGRQVTISEERRDPALTSHPRGTNPNPRKSPSAESRSNCDEDQVRVSVGLLTSESPDAVSAWRGRKREVEYGRPKLACDAATRALVMPPVHKLWPVFMDNQPCVVRSDTIVLDSSDMDSDTFQKWRRQSHVNRPKGTEYVRRSSREEARSS